MKSKNIKDLISVTTRPAINGEDEDEFQIEGRFKNGEKYVIATFDSSCEAICDAVVKSLNNELLQQNTAFQIGELVEFINHKYATDNYLRSCIGLKYKITPVENWKDETGIFMKDGKLFFIDYSNRWWDLTENNLISLPPTK